MTVRAVIQAVLSRFGMMKGILGPSEVREASFSEAAQPPLAHGAADAWLVEDQWLAGLPTYRGECVGWWWWRGP